jgi:hypothetical protein
LENKKGVYLQTVFCGGKITAKKDRRQIRDPNLSKGVQEKK